MRASNQPRVGLAIAGTFGILTALAILPSPGLAAAQPSAQAAASDVDAQTVRYPSGTASIEAYVVRPTGAAKRGAVLLVHDDLGLNDAVRGVARLFAQAGFVALAPNLLSRSAGAAPQRGAGGGGEGLGRRTPVMGLPLAQTVDDVKAGFAFLQQDAGVDAARISAVGLGWGGYRVWKLAQQTPTLYRAVVFYGTTPTEEQLSALTVPVLAHYAQFDFLQTASALKTQKQLGKKFTYHIYPTDRGFLGGGSGNAVDITALAGEQDLFASNSPTRAPVPPSDKPAAGATAAVRLALERTFAFLRN